MRLEFLGLLMLVPAPTWAYVDPGAGSYLIQMLLAGILGSLFAFKNYWTLLWQRLRDKFRKH